MKPKMLLLFSLPVVSMLIIALILAKADSPEPDNSSEVVLPASGQIYFPVDPLTDSQGNVVVEVTQLNLNNPSDTLDFDVALNTHSVDLNMNLVEAATLTTDTGLVISPTRWDAPRGGHHVSGRLVFPAQVDGNTVLEGATQLTLTVRDVAAPERNFSWTLQTATGG